MAQGAQVRFGGIQGKLFAAFLAVSLVPLLIVWVLDRGQAEDLASQAAENSLRQTSDVIVGSIDDWTDLNVKVLQLAGTQPEVRAGNLAASRGLLIGLQAQLPWVNFAHVMSPSGQDMARGDNLAAVNYGDRQYFKDALSKAIVTTDVVISKTTKKPTLAIAAPIIGESAAPVGVISLAANLDDITDAILKKKIGSTGYVTLTDASGKVIASPKVAGGKELTDLSRNPLIAAAKSGRMGLLEVEVDGRKVMAYAQRTRMGWIAVVQQDLSEVNAPIRSLDLSSLILLLVTSGIVVGLALVSSRGLVRPIVHLTEVADQISRGQLEHKLPESDRADEIGALAKSIDRLAKSMKLAMDRLRSK